MNYPLISEYIESIKSAEDNFDELSHLMPVLNDEGLPVMTSGNFAVVFKMKDEQKGKLYAVKCFTKEQEGRAEAYREITKELENVSSPYLTSVRYFDKELFVDTNTGEDKEFPILLMDWIEGLTLDVFISENINNQFALEMLAYQFDEMAAWLLTQPFAHGDLKSDNIIMKEDGQLVLIDYDGMYVPAMKGKKAREVGSPGYRHPSRTENVFDEHIDDFPIASIALSLKAISLKPVLWNEFGGKGRILFSEKDFLSLYDSDCHSSLQLLTYDQEFCKLYGIFMIAFSLNNLSSISCQLFFDESPSDIAMEHHSVYLEGVENIKKKEYKKSFSLFSSLLDKGGIAKMYGSNGLGYLYVYGYSVTKNPEMAVRYFKQAAKNGWAIPLFNLGICFEKGIGVEHSQEVANFLFNLSKHKGLDESFYANFLFSQHIKDPDNVNVSWLSYEEEIAMVFYARRKRADFILTTL